MGQKSPNTAQLHVAWVQGTAKSYGLSVCDDSFQMDLSRCQQLISVGPRRPQKPNNWAAWGHHTVAMLLMPHSECWLTRL